MKNKSFPKSNIRIIHVYLKEEKRHYKNSTHQHVVNFPCVHIWYCFFLCLSSQSQTQNFEGHSYWNNPYWFENHQLSTHRYHCHHTKVSDQHHSETKSWHLKRMLKIIEKTKKNIFYNHQHTETFQVGHSCELDISLI